MAARVWREGLVVSLVLALAACSGSSGRRPGDDVPDGSGASAASGGSSGLPIHPTPSGGSYQASAGEAAVSGGAPSEPGVGGRAPDNTAGAPETAGAGGAAEEAVGIQVDASGSNMLHESYGTMQLHVVLTAQPSAKVVVGLRSADTAHAVVSPLSLIFTPENWSTAQTAVVAGVRDTVADGGNSVTIETVPAVSADARYAGLDAADFEVYVIDETDPGIVVGAAGNTTESGGTATFYIVLTSQPTATVTIPLSSNDLTEGTVAQSVVFEPNEWSTPHPVTVTGVDDQLPDGAQVYQIVTGLVVSDDLSYSGVNPADVSLTNVDNE